MLELIDIKLERENRKVLKGISAKFEDRKIYAILGNNGVGKSTLAYIIMGLESYRDHEGEIIFDGKKINEKSVSERAKLGITLVWQEPARFEGLTVKEYLTLGSKKRFSEMELLEALRIVGLSGDYLYRFADNSLSGGERKRIELASILLLNPKFVVLDEPDSGIDIISTNMIEEVLRKLKNAGATLLVITHREEIAKMADEAYLMCDGEFLESGTVDKIIEFYKSHCDNCNHINKPEEGELSVRNKVR
ncbi:MAG TPA: ATP-binding cassette domain-containing protein [Thermotogaceae bacterium]|nr:ATP-binding cassette domain-containing protein [Thermotogota bacterium]HEW91674.1 ATP-binding cassette domain-containing protein [Thermotogaceae bacterium]